MIESGIDPSGFVKVFINDMIGSIYIFKFPCSVTITLLT